MDENNLPLVQASTLEPLKAGSEPISQRLCFCKRPRLPEKVVKVVFTDGIKRGRLGVANGVSREEDSGSPVKKAFILNKL